jgi:diguanylate cyclase (GGDEF)-like protein
MLHESRLTCAFFGALAAIVMVATIFFGTERLAAALADFAMIDHAVASIALSGLIAFAFAAPAAGFILQRRANRALEKCFGHIIHHDSQTGLLNRDGFVSRLDALLTSEAACRDGVGVVHIDLIGLQPVNDSYGHEAGDAVLQAVAVDLARGMPEHSLVSRLGGAEFMLAFPIDLGRAKGIAQHCARQTAERLMSVIARARRIAGHDIELTASMGICTAPDGGNTAEALLKSSQLALVAAKAAGPGSVRFYDRALESLVGERRAIERRIREAVAAQTFELHFQPLYRNHDRKLAGYEALLRLPAGKEAFVSPAIFVPIAEELGLISKIGDWVIRSACRFAAEWPDDCTIAVNLSPAQFRDGSVSRVVREALEETGLDPKRLELEITEGILMNDTQAVLCELNTLKGMGVAIVLDDFGTGYSSLSYLWKFPFDKIKIDRSFMRALDDKDKLVGKILLAIVSLSRSLQLRVTAEGVENQAQAEFLRELACDQVQGFLFGRPIPMKDVAAKFLRDARRPPGIEVYSPALSSASH